MNFNISNDASNARAGEDTLSSLHGLFAAFLMTRLKSGDIKPAELNVIRQFLKDNNIECVGQYNDTLSDIAEQLPQFVSVGDYGLIENADRQA